MLCSVKDRWEDGMNQYMSTAQMVQSCRVHILISYPFETEINNPFIIGNSCQPAERSDCDLGWNSLQGFCAARRLDWMLIFKKWPWVWCWPILGHRGTLNIAGVWGRQLWGMWGTAPAMEHQCRGSFGAWRHLGENTRETPLLLPEGSSGLRRVALPCAGVQDDSDTSLLEIQSGKLGTFVWWPDPLWKMLVVLLLHCAF